MKVEDNQGMTPFDCAKKQGSLEILALFRSAFAAKRPKVPLPPRQYVIRQLGNSHSMPLK
jgi:hypothetical protein